MNKTRAIIITGNGSSGETEAAHACKLAGFDDVKIAHIAELLSGKVALDDYHFLNLAGGFTDGDDLGSAKVMASRILHDTVAGSGEKLLAQFSRFIKAGKLMLGAGNGFQLMVKLGILPAMDGNHLHQTVTLTRNSTDSFQNRWCYLKADPAAPCIFTKGVQKGIYLPVRHGEGRFVTDTAETLERIEASHLAVLKYSDKSYAEDSMDFPANPNGSSNAIAGLCDPTGRLFGLMAHPEAFTHYTQHPRWTREQLPENGDGLLLYKNAANFVKNNLV